MSTEPYEVRLDTPEEWSTREWHERRPHADHVAEGAHRPRLELAATVARRAALELNVDIIIDLGAGTGGLLSLIDHDLITGGEWFELLGYDWHTSSRARAAERGIPVVEADVVELARTRSIVPAGNRAVVTATELIEHLDDPHQFVADLYADDRIEGIVLSSPRLETADSYSEGHRFAWNEAGYRQLVELHGWRTAYHGTAGPFQVIHATRGGNP